MRARPTATLVATVLTLTAPAAADASTVSITAGAGPSANEYIVYRASSGERNRIAVNITRRSIVLVDKGVRRIRQSKDTPFGSCRSTSPRRIVCPNIPLFVSMRDGNDRFTAAPGAAGSAPTGMNPFQYAASYIDTEGAEIITVSVNGGSGDDFMSGTKYDDDFLPGPGRDRVEGRGGPDNVFLQPDGARDVVLGDGGIDGVTFRGDSPVTIDMAAGTGGPAGDLDRIASNVERAHGGRGADTLLGSDRTEALYGEDGVDTVDGRGGNDYIAGDSPVVSEGAAANTLIGGDGDDVFDTRVYKDAPTNTIDCGPGTDAHLGDVEARINGSCESTILRLGFFPDPFPSDDEEELAGDPMKVAPVAKTSDSVTFEAVCPFNSRESTGCSGTITLERPPGAAAEQFGSGSFNLAMGQRGNVTVPLNAAGQAAVAGSEPVAVRVVAEVVSDNTPPAGTARFRTGWQADL
ncbi:MAG: hypothetical protein M3340_11870 [Actinomycetota bacterium]|nr:hypothetical protein [Actinomycetota bacterium]